MYEIVKFTDDQGRDVQITPEDVKRHLCPQATDSEVGMFLALCKAQRLNPFIRDAYLVKYGNGPASIITSKEAFTKRASANKSYRGFEAGVVFMDKHGNVQHREGSAVYKAAGETLVGGWCRVFVEGRQPFYDEVPLSEYSTGKSGWSKMPATMIRKVAVCHALREAYPESLQQLYTAEEMGNAGEIAMELQSKPEPIPVVEYEEMAREDQLMMITEQMAELSEIRGVSFDEVMGKLYASKTVAAMGVTPDDALTEQQADVLLTLLGRWIEQARTTQQPDAVQVAMESARAASMANEDIAF